MMYVIGHTESALACRHHQNSCCGLRSPRQFCTAFVMQIDPILHTTLENSPHITNKKIYSCKTDPKFYFSHPILSSPQIGSVIMGGKQGKKYKICIFDPTMDISHPILDTPQIVNVNMGGKATSKRGDPKLPTPY
jgi:hypothetical protein